MAVSSGSVKSALTMNPARPRRTVLDQRYWPQSPGHPLPGHLDFMGGGRCHRRMGAGRPKADSSGTNSPITASSCSSDSAPAVIVATRTDSASATAAA